MQNTLLNKATILIVDDTPGNIELLSSILRHEYKIKIATNGEQGLKIAAIKPYPDVILLDIMMPVMNGFEMCKAIKSNPQMQDIPIIFITAKDSHQDEHHGLSLGAADYIRKPINPLVVKARVATHTRLSNLITELTVKNRQLEEMAILRDDIDRILRHDLKSPLNAVLTLPDLILKSEQVSEATQKKLAFIKKAGKKLLDMINSSLDLYKMETGRYQLKPVVVDISVIVEQIKIDMESFTGAKNTPINFSNLSAHLPHSVEISGEELLCYALLGNLIKNAIEASPPGHPISVTTEKMDQQVKITVHNAGTIPQTIRENFFDKYVTLGKSHGTGLGTYSARLMTEVQQGDIAFSSSEDTGTALIIHLPAA